MNVSKWLKYLSLFGYTTLIFSTEFLGSRLAQAQVLIRNFEPRYQTQTRGNIGIIGNTLMTCDESQTNSIGVRCPDVRAGDPAFSGSTNIAANNYFFMNYVDIDRIAAVLTKYPAIAIELQGHTDSRASSQYNMALSKRRAEATRNYLLKQGVDPAKITILPLGESQLRRSGNTIIDHAYNRRVEMIFRDLRGVDIIFEEQDSDLQLEQ